MRIFFSILIANEMNEMILQVLEMAEPFETKHHALDALHARKPCSWEYRYSSHNCSWHFLPKELSNDFPV